MAILEILTYPDPFLKKTTLPVLDIDDVILKMIEDMAETMYAAPGVGLAANQAGFDKSVIVYDPEPDNNDGNYHVLINPRIIEMKGEMNSENEGCLSVPDYRADIKRAEWIKVEGLDKEGKELKFEADGFLAVILQHEIDHLNGILFIDRISALKRSLYKRRVMKQMKNK